jgi:hypothetical protein
MSTHPSSYTVTRRTFLKGAGALTGLWLANEASGQRSVNASSGAQTAARAALRRQPTAGRPLLLAHYMPWYQTPPVTGYWGWHWTMDHFDPTQQDAQGRPQIASHYMPLTGPYDSSDDALLEYQIMLMKLSGIDGVIADWYGTANFRDYATLNRSTGKLFEHITRAGLTFAICYEDQTVKHMVDEGRMTREEGLAHGQDMVRYMHEQWFGSDAYLKTADQPVLFTFGPQYFKSAADWETMFEVADPRPALVTLDGHMVAGALASYPWPQMMGYDLNLAAVEAQLTQFYRKARRWDYVVGGAFPGFHDIYEEAGVRSSYGTMDALDGEMFRFTLQMALDQNPDVIQLITWNDYGEGTIIEPTEEFGYRYLEVVQTTQQALQGADFSFTAANLQLPLQIFNLRKAAVGDAAINALLNAAVDAVFSGDLDAAAGHIANAAGN